MSRIESRTSLRRKVWLVVSLAHVAPALISLDPGWAHAQEPAASERSPNVVEAERYAAQAFDAYARKDYQQALALYEAALAAARSADILYNIARVYDVGLHDGPSAIEYYQRYQAEPKALPARREFAERRIAELQEAHTAPLLANGSATPAAGLVPDDLPTPVPAAPVADSGAWTWREATATALVAGGVVGLGLGIGFGVSAYSADEWKSDCDGNVCRTQQGVDAAHTAANRAHVATVALAVGGGLLASGAALWLFAPKHEQSGGTQLGLRVTPSGSGADVALSGKF